MTVTVGKSKLVKFRAANATGPGISPLIKTAEGELNIEQAFLKNTSYTTVGEEGSFSIDEAKTELFKALLESPLVYKAGGTSGLLSGVATQQEALGALSGTSTLPYELTKQSN